MSKAAISVTAFALGSAYGVCLALNGGALTAGGHGSEFYLMLALSPFSTSSALGFLGFVFWPLISIILVTARSRVGLIAVVLALSSHYVANLISAVRMTMLGEWHYVVGMFEAQTLISMSALLLYLAGQCTLWTLLYHAWKRMQRGSILNSGQPGE
jgi:hypothetical protein